MSEANLPTVSAKITGDASQLVSEFKRAEVQTSVSAAKIDAQLGQMQTRIAHRFNLAHISTDVLRGLGVGSGFAVAEKASELIAKYWKDAADSAKELEKSSEHQLQQVEAGLKARRNDDQELTKLMIERDRLQKHFDATKDRSFDRSVINPAISAGTGLPEWLTKLLVPKFVGEMGVDSVNDEKAAKGGKLADELQRVGNAIDENVRKGNDAFASASKALEEKMRTDWRAAHEHKAAPDHVSTQMLRSLQAIQAHLERSGGVVAGSGIH